MALSGFLERILGWPTPEKTANKLEIVAAVFGDHANQRRYPRIRQTCRATSYIKRKCSEVPATGVRPFGLTHCFIDQNGGSAPEYCGFDPSPQGAKDICISYRCGQGKLRHGCWPGETRRI
jgi:hypothetical protein